jgi:hypothetical protein
MREGWWSILNFNKKIVSLDLDCAVLFESLAATNFRVVAWLCVFSSRRSGFSLLCMLRFFPRPRQWITLFLIHSSVLRSWPPGSRLLVGLWSLRQRSSVAVEFSPARLSFPPGCWARHQVLLPLFCSALLFNLIFIFPTAESTYLRSFSCPAAVLPATVSLGMTTGRIWIG